MRIIYYYIYNETNSKEKGILLLLFIILLFTFLNLIMDYDSKKGFSFLGIFKKKGGGNHHVIRFVSN